MFKQPAQKRKVDSIETSSPSAKVARTDDRLDTTALKRLITQFEKAINTNLEERLKYANDPEKFMESEIKLDNTVKQLQEQFVPNVELYGSFVKWGGVELLLSLLTHENTDIMLDVLDMISEFTEGDSIRENEEEATILIKKLLDQEIVSLVISVLTDRGLNDANADEAKGVHNILSIIENLIEYDPQIAATATRNTPLLDWCTKNVCKAGEMESNQLYAAEILCILMTNEDNREYFEEQERLELLLVRIGYYRKNKPKDLSEEELLENLFDILCSVLMRPQVRDVFRRLEGLELMLILVRYAGVKTISYALLENEKNCARFVQIQGLKTLFAVYMNSPKKEEQDYEEHVVSCIVSLLRFTYGEENLRIIQKFTENEGEKAKRLMTLHLKYYLKVYQFDKRVSTGELQKTLGTDDEEEIFRERLDAGLFLLQQICLIIAYLLVSPESDKIKEKIFDNLASRSIPPSTIGDILQFYAENVSADENDPERQRIVELIKQLEPITNQNK